MYGGYSLVFGMVAYADDSSLSDLTCMPPEERAMVSAPEMSVKWMIVLL